MIPAKLKKINTVLENKVVGHQNSYIMFKIIIKNCDITIGRRKLLNCNANFFLTLAKMCLAKVKECIVEK